MQKLGFDLHEKTFLLGNFFPDLIHSYFWRPHEYHHSRTSLQKMIDGIKKRPIFLSFRLGVLTHYISDYFCYPHSGVYNKGIFRHIMYELRQTVPEELFRLNLNIRTFAVEELDRFVKWYERFRPLFRDDDHDFHMATLVSSHFLKAAYEWLSVESPEQAIDGLLHWEGQYPVYGRMSA
jgi:hypothetical protein